MTARANITDRAAGLAETFRLVQVFLLDYLVFQLEKFAGPRFNAKPRENVPNGSVVAEAHSPIDLLGYSSVDLFFHGAKYTRWRGGLSPYYGTEVVL